MKGTKKLHINTRGKINKHVYNVMARVKAAHLGLQTYIKHKKNGEVELSVEGSSDKLWKMLDWAKKSRFFYIVHEVTFQLG